ncbi:MAG: hypothetical protein FIB06_11340 [Betaproteobacteria bacterium]|nr:hypothetical protein [Betaproteobacteria bacterium]
MWLGVATMVLALATAPAVAADAAPEAMHSPNFAVVNGQVVTTQEFELAFAQLVRQRFYHGSVPEAELGAAREEVKKLLVQRVVLVQEGRRRNIQPDEKSIQEVLDGIDRRFAGNPDWPAARDEVLRFEREQREEQSIVHQLQASVIAALPAPTEAQVRDFYQRNPDLFTEPEKYKLSIILLRVDPSSPATAWEGTREEGRGIYRRLQAGADFDETAKLHSDLKMEEGAGSSLGYLHRGMLPQSLQDKVDKLEIGKVNEPVDALEGVVISRLDDKTAPRKRDFADVSERARELFVRDREEQAWKSLVTELVSKANVKYLYPAQGAPGK